MPIWLRTTGESAAGEPVVDYGLRPGRHRTVRTRFALRSCRVYAAREFAFYLFHEAFPICSISKRLILACLFLLFSCSPLIVVWAEWNHQFVHRTVLRRKSFRPGTAIP